MSLSKAKISKYRLKKIIKHFCVDVEASKVAKLLGINRNTINHYYSIFRKVIYEYQVNEKKKMVGETEVDESYFGRRRQRGFRGKLKRGRGTQKQPVFGIFGRKGRVFTEIIPDCKKKTLQALILGRVSREAVIYSDGWKGYDGLVDMGFDRHYRVNHGENEFSKGDGVHINGIESFWSFTKRRLNKFNGVKKNFSLHLKECEWRWDRKPKELRENLSHILRRYAKIVTTHTLIHTPLVWILA